MTKNKMLIQKLVSLSLAILLLLTGCGSTKTMDVDSYLKEYAREINFEKGMNNKTFGNAEGYRVFLAGEYHTMVKSIQTHKMLIQYLHEHQGVNYILMEAGLADTILLNEYIQTGSQELMDFYMAQIDGTQGCSEETYALYQWMYEYNSKQPEDKKLHLLGLDVEHQRNSAARGLSMLIDENVTPAPEIAPLLERFQAYDGKSITELAASLQAYPSAMQAVFGDNFPLVEQISKNIESTKTFMENFQASNINSHEHRDKAMMENLEFYLARLPEDAKFFGQFGCSHVYQSAYSGNGSKDYQRFGMRLTADSSPVKGQVCTLQLMYIVGTQSKRSGRMNYTFDSWNSGFSPDLFQGYFGRDTFIPLDQPGSPFMVGEGDEPVDERASELSKYFQKVLLIYNSENTMPYHAQKQ